jgi:protocatechuate 3,4-dioxygenase beta subunit
MLHRRPQESRLQMNRIIPILTFVLAAAAVVYLLTRSDGEAFLDEGARTAAESGEAKTPTGTRRRNQGGAAATATAAEVSEGQIRGRCVNGAGEGVMAEISATLTAPPGPAHPAFSPRTTTIQSDESGRFSLELRHFLKVRLRVRAGGYRDYRSPEFLFTGSTIALGEIHLLPGLSLEMKVRDDAGEPAVDALVEAGPLETRGRERGDGGTFFAGLDADALRSARTNSEGGVRVDGLAPGKLQIRVTAPGFLPWASRDHVLTEHDDAFEIRLARGRRLELSFRDESGAGVPGVAVALDAMGYAPEDALIAEDLRLRGRSNAEGELRIGPLGPRPYRLVCTKPGYIAPAERIIRKEDQRAEVLLRRAGRVSGQILSEKGPVRLSKNSLSLAPLRKRGRAAGGRLLVGEALAELGFNAGHSDFAVVDLQGKSLRLNWNGESGARGFYDLKDVEPGRDRAITLELSAAAGASGQVFDFRGKPVGDAVVSARLVRAPDGGEKRQVEKALLSGDPSQLDAMRGRLEFRPALNHVIKTDDEGAYRFQGLMVGARYAFRAKSPSSGESDPIEFLVSAEGLLEVELRLAPQGSLRGRLLDAQGSPIPGRIVYLRRDQVDAGANPLARVVLGPLVARTWTDLEGRFRFDAISPGSLVVDLGPQRPGQGSIPSQAVTIRAGRETRVELQYSE